MIVIVFDDFVKSSRCDWCRWKEEGKNRIEVRQSILYSAESLISGQGHEKEQKPYVSIGVMLLDVGGKDGERRGKQDRSKEDIL